MNVSLKDAADAGVSQRQEQLGYKTIWCRLENGFFWLWRSRPAHVADRLVNEYNELVQSGRKYHAFPMGFDANLLALHAFALTVVQSIEDHLRRPNDVKYRRIKEQVAELATSHHGMTQVEVENIEREFTAAFKLTRGTGGYGTGD